VFSAAAFQMPETKLVGFWFRMKFTSHSDAYTLPRFSPSDTQSTAIQ